MSEHCLKKTHFNFIGFRELALLALCFCLTGCPELEQLLNEINSVIETESGGKRENFKVVVAKFNAICGPVDWLCGSDLQMKIFNATVEGVKEATKHNPKIQYVGHLTDTGSDLVYGMLKEGKKLGRDVVKNNLGKMVDETGGNTLVFGGYYGDDHKMIVKPQMLITTRDNAWASADEKTFQRDDDRRKVFQTITIMVRDLLIATFKQ